MTFDEHAIGRDLDTRVRRLLATHDPAHTEPHKFLEARFDTGLAWVQFPEGHGGLGVPQSFQEQVNAALTAAGAPEPAVAKNGIGLGMAAPTILRSAPRSRSASSCGPLWTGEEIWCQLFSEPGAGSDLAGAGHPRGPRRRRLGRQRAEGVDLAGARTRRWAILVARTDPDVPKHRASPTSCCDMTDPGVEVRPLRQITGEAEFNEVFLTDVRVPDADRLGEVGEGWRVAHTTLMNERVAIGGGALPREGGMIGKVAAAWREQPELRTPGLHDELLRLWVDAEVARLTGERLRQQLAAGQPGPEGSAMKLAFARLDQEISGLEMELLGEEGLRYDDWTMRRPETSTSPAATPATATCAPRATRSRAAPRRSCATSSPSGCSACPPNPASTRTCLEGPAPMSTANLLYTDTEDALRDTVRRLFADRCKPEAVVTLYDASRCGLHRHLEDARRRTRTRRTTGARVARRGRREHPRGGGGHGGDRARGRAGLTGTASTRGGATCHPAR